MRCLRVGPTIAASRVAVAATRSEVGGISGAAVGPRHDVVGGSGNKGAAGQPQLAAPTLAIDHEPLRSLELGAEAASLTRNAAMVLGT